MLGRVCKTAGNRARSSASDGIPVPNMPDPNEVGRWLDTLFSRYPELPIDSVAHVFGEHTTQRFGQHQVPYIEPQRVQESTAACTDC